MVTPLPLALFGFPSVEDIVRKVVSLFFGALSHALLPDFLRNGTVDAIKWLIAVPNPANAQLWPNVGRLEGDMAALAWGLLGLTCVTAVVRHTLAGFGGTHPIAALSHTVAAAAGITGYHWAFANSVALVNVLTHQVLTWPVVAQGLGRTVKVIFGGSLLIGTGSVFLAVLALVAILLAVALFVMKVAVLMLAAILYVTGPAVIALYPLAETARITRLWSSLALAVALVPLGWCVIFATAGAISLDVTSFGALGNQGAAGVIGAKTTGAFAGLLMFWFAAAWPFKVGRHLGPVGQVVALPRGVPRSGAGAAGGLGGSTRVQAAQARLRAGVMAGGAVLGRAAGAAGLPRGGLGGAGVRQTRKLSSAIRATPRYASARSAITHTAGGALAPFHALGRRVVATRVGANVSRRAQAAAGLLRYGPREMRRAAAEAGRPSRRSRAGARAAAPATAPTPDGRDRTSGGASAQSRKPRPSANRTDSPRHAGRGDGRAAQRPRPRAPRIPPGPRSEAPPSAAQPTDNPGRDLPRRAPEPEPDKAPAPRLRPPEDAP